MGTMDFKADPSAVSINLLLIVHPEEAASKQKGPREGRAEGSPSPGLQDDGNGNSSSQPPPGRDLQGPQVTVEIHPKDSPPQLFKKLSPGKGFQTTEAPRPPGGKDLHAYPWDRASLKSLPVDLQRFEKLDAYALKVDVKSSVEELVRALLKQAHSDLEKVRAIWMWICHHIEYDVVGYHNKSQLASRPLDVLQAGKGICEGYAGLFEHMCSQSQGSSPPRPLPKETFKQHSEDEEEAPDREGGETLEGSLEVLKARLSNLVLAGIQCMKLFGYSKGNGYRAGQTFTGDSDHAWNAVYLDGRWHLLDSTWGSGSVDDSFTKFTFRYNEFYFLTHPALFINNHFPDNSNWQLLKPALTLQDFENNLLHNSNFYTLGLLAAHPQTAVIQTVNGKASVSVDCRPATLFTFKLRGTAQQGLLTLKRRGMHLDIYPQKTGSHKLQIFAKPSRGSGDVYQCVLEYLVECRSVDAAQRLPRELPQPVGPSWLSERQGFLRPSHPGPVVHTNDGRCSLTFTLGRDVLVLASLQGEGGSLPEELGMQHVMAVRRGAQLELKVQLPRAGTFVLKLYAKKKSEPGNYDYVFNYVLSCLNAEVRWPAFPLSYSKWGQDYEVLEPLAGVLPAARTVRFRLRMQGVAKVLVQAEGSYPLTHNRGYWEGSCSTAGCREVFVMVHENANHSFYSHVLKYQVESQ